MATFNATGSTNNANIVEWSFGTALELRSDRPGVTVARGGLVELIANLGVGVAAGDPFTIAG